MPRPNLDHLHVKDPEYFEKISSQTREMLWYCLEMIQQLDISNLRGDDVLIAWSLSHIAMEQLDSLERICDSSKPKSS